MKMTLAFSLVVLTAFLVANIAAKNTAEQPHEGWVRPEHQLHEGGIKPEHPSLSGCGNRQYECLNGECISEPYVCDGYWDCSKGEDEFCCDPQEFKCSHHECIPTGQVCNGVMNCSNGKDEDCSKKKNVAHHKKTEGSPLPEINQRGEGNEI